MSFPEPVQWVGDEPDPYQYDERYDAEDPDEDDCGWLDEIDAEEPAAERTLTGEAA